MKWQRFHSSASPLSLFLFALFVNAPPAAAQYMYLDSNGDGVHTAADELNAVGPTVIDIWFDIGHNRDGSVATCKASAAEPLNMFSYVVDLSASGGTVSYSAYTNRVQEMGPVGGPRPPDGTNFSTGPFYTAGIALLPPGKYLLGTLTVYAVSGTPAIQIVPGTDLDIFLDITAFGSQCSGTEYPNTIALGTDWFDADGLPAGTGGTPDQSPHLASVADMTVRSGENASAALSATDPEGQPLLFSKAAGPDFMYVTTLDPGSGTALGEIRLAPFASDAGVVAAGVTVTDGVASDRADFQITVFRGPDHIPYLPPLPRITVVAGRASSFLLIAGDPDGGTIHFAKVDGPAYVGLRQLAGREGGSSAVLSIRPAICDIGTATATISATDGVTTQERRIEISVVSSAPDPGPAVRHFSAGFLNAIALGDLDGDGNPDVVGADEGEASISVLLSDGQGNLGPAVSYDVPGRNGTIAISDFNGDGARDVAVTDPAAAGVAVLLGAGNGTLFPGTLYDTATGPIGIEATDLNRDGFVDLVTVNQESGTISALIGAGDGTFATRRDSPAGFGPTAFTVGDFNLDGRTDVAVANPLPGSGSLLTILPGLGDGTFGDGLPTPFTGFTFSLMTGDWNWDGLPDLAVVDSRLGTIQTFAGAGDGTFASGVIVSSTPPPAFLYAGLATDMNSDGNSDLVVSDVNTVRLLVMLGNGTGGFSGPVFLPGRFAQGLAAGDLDSDGRPDLVGTGFLAVSVYMNTFPAPATVDSRAHAPGGPTGGQNLCVRIELRDKEDGPPERPLVDPGTVVLRSEDTGSVSEISSIAARRVVVTNTADNQGAGADICFASQDVAALFDRITKKTKVVAQVSGSTMDGRLFCSTVALIVGEKPKKSKPAFAPNPLNPASRLTFSTLREGPAKVLLFDIQGRRVRQLLDTPNLPAGEHEYVFDGATDSGSRLPSGVYFYRVQSTEGKFEGRIVILK